MPQFRPAEAAVGLALVRCRAGGCLGLFDGRGLAGTGLRLVPSCPVQATWMVAMSALVAIRDLGGPEHVPTSPGRAGNRANGLKFVSEGPQTLATFVFCFVRRAFLNERIKKAIKRTHPYIGSYNRI